MLEILKGVCLLTGILTLGLFGSILICMIVPTIAYLLGVNQ